MSRRNPSGFTGANAIPLGTRNKAIGAKRSFTSSPPKEEPVKPNESSIQASQAFKAAQAAAASLSKLAHLEPSSNTNGKLLNKLKLRSNQTLKITSHIAL